MRSKRDKREESESIQAIISFSLSYPTHLTQTPGLPKETEKKGVSGRKKSSATIITIFVSHLMIFDIVYHCTIFLTP